MSYTPADPYTDGSVFLDLYSPTDPPPKGTKIDTAGAGDRQGTKQLLLSSFEGGKYTVVLSAYDYFGRPVQFNLNTGFSSGKQGPDLTFVSSSEPSLADAAPPAPPVAEVTTEEPTVATETPSTPAVVSEPVSGYPTFILGRKGAWSAYRVHYRGDWSELRIIAVYDPSDRYRLPFSPVIPTATRGRPSPTSRQGLKCCSLLPCTN